jgi:hypothetical protein
VCPVRKLNSSSPFPRFPLQQTSDNAENVKEIERRVHSLSDVLVSPVSEDDHAERTRRAVLQRFVLVRYTHRFAYLFPRNLERVIAKLEPLSGQHGLVGFLRSADNAKTLTGFVQELADAVTDYQVRAADPTAISTERPARFRYNKGCTREQGRSTMTPRTYMAIQRTSVMIPGTSLVIPRTSE